MATKKAATSKPKAKPKATSPSRLQNLAARPSYDDMLDEQLVDHSGVFRVTSQIAQAQTGHDEEAGMRFPNDSLVMAAQRDGFTDDGPTVDEAVDDRRLDDETIAAEKRARLATLAARVQARNGPRRR